MNLIDFTVTKITGPVQRHDYIWGTVWKLPVEYSDDGGDGQTTELLFFTEGLAEKITVGYVGQH